VEASGWLDSTLSCSVYYGLYLENKQLELRTQLQDTEGDLWEQLLQCGPDPNVVLAGSVGGTLAGALLLLLSKLQ